VVWAGKWLWPGLRITKVQNTLLVEWYYLKNNYLTLRSNVKVPWRSLCNTLCNTPPYGHAPTYQISLTYLERQKCYGPDKKILFKKQLFDLEVKGQGPTKVIMVRDTHIPNIIDISGKTKKLWSGQASLPFHWYVMQCEIWRKLITDHMWVTLCYCPMKLVLMWLKGL
jgi:hypothetical protein